jgi:hypothetical protein
MRIVFVFCYIEGNHSFVEFWILKINSMSLFVEQFLPHDMEILTLEIENVSSCTHNLHLLTMWMTIYLEFQLSFQHCTNRFKILSKFQWRKKQSELLNCLCINKENKNKRMDTGRCWGRFFQHIFINSRSFSGQSEGISGVNPSSLYSTIKSLL